MPRTPAASGSATRKSATKKSATRSSTTTPTTRTRSAKKSAHAVDDEDLPSSTPGAAAAAESASKISPVGGRTRSAKTGRKRRGESEDSSTAAADAAASSAVETPARKAGGVKRATAAAAAAASAVSETPRRRTRSSSGASAVDVEAETPVKESKGKKQGGVAASRSTSSNVSTPRRRTRSTSGDDGMEVDKEAAATTDTATGVAKRAAVLSPVAEQVDEKEKEEADGTTSEKEEYKTTPKQKKGSASSASTKKSTRTNKKKEEAQLAGDDVEMTDGSADAKGGTAPSSSGKKTKRGSRGRGSKKTVEDNTGAGATSTAATTKRANSITPDASQASAAVATQPQKQIDVAVHRIRHLNYIPRGINRLASTPLPPPSLTTDTSSSTGSSSSNNKDGLYASSYIATAREGGAVELLAVDQKWRGVATVPGLRNREVDALTWICGHGRGINDSKDDAGNDSDEDVADTKTKGGGTTYSCTSHKESERIHSPRRLFGASRDGTVFEIDFRTQRHSHVTPSGGGGVFCLESLCPECVCSDNTSIDGGKHFCCGGYLAAGCEDGSIKIYRAYNDDDTTPASPSRTLDLVSTLPSAGSAVLSLAWRRSDGKNGVSSDGLGGSVLYAGVADGTIRRYDCLSAINAARASGSSAHAISTGSVLMGGSQTERSGGPPRWRSTHRMTVETLGRRTATKVWALKALSDGTIVSGDSLGHVHFWDGHSGTLMSKFVQNENRADVLDLAVSSNECKVFASGVDSRVICIERVPNQAPSTSVEVPAASHPSEVKWVQSQAQRPHTHDVKSLCICHMKDPIGAAGAKSNAKGLGRELLCSGGVDTKVCTYLVSKFRQHRAKKVFPWPSSSPVSVANNRRVLALMRSGRIDIYRLGANESMPKKSSDPPYIVDEDKIFMGSIEISSLYNLVCADISSDGGLVAASDGANLMIFSLQYITDEADGGPREVVLPTKLAVPKKARSACSAVKFAHGSNSRLFCATTKGPIKVLRIERSNDEGMNTDESPPKNVSLEHTFDTHVGSSSRRRETETYAASELAVSPDGAWLAASRFGMGSGTILLFSVPESGDGYRQWWSLPAFEAPPSCIKFLGRDKAEALAVACSNNTFYIFDHEERCLSDWSQDAGFPVSSSLPRELIHRADYPVRMAFNTSNPSKFLLGAHGFFCIVDLDQPMPEHSNIFPPNHVRARRFVPKKSRASSIGDESAAANKDGGVTPPRRKRKRSLSNAGRPEREQNGNFTICLRYSGMLFMDFIAENEMVVVEQPWMNVVNALPDALARRVYGS